MERMSDIELLELSYKRPEAFGVIFDRKHKEFMKVARSYLREDSATEDAVQNTFVKIYRYGRKFLNEGGNFNNWSRKILQNCIVDEAAKRKVFIDFSYELENIADEKDNFREYESADFLSTMLEKIDNSGAEILRMRYVLGKSFKQIGKVLGISSGAARVKAYRAKKFLGEVYEQMQH